jgi:tetratricopeptide (TPR) repeat protein
MVDFDSASQFDPGVATAYRAYFTAAPFLMVPESLAAIRPTLGAISAPSVPPPTDATIHFTVHQGNYGYYRHYLVGLYAAMAGDYALAERSAATLSALTGTTDQGKLGSNLAIGIRSEIALRQGRPADALAQLDRLDLQIPYLLPITTPFYFNARERYRKAEILEGMGKTEDALRWYTSIDAQMPFDVVYLPPSLLKRAELSERLGRTGDARALYQRVLRLVPHPDPGFQSLLDRARAGRQRLSPSR